jgi:hypothetical protein
LYEKTARQQVLVQAAPKIAEAIVLPDGSPVRIYVPTETTVVSLMRANEAFFAPQRLPIDYLWDVVSLQNSSYSTPTRVMSLQRSTFPVIPMMFL